MLPDLEHDTVSGFVGYDKSDLVQNSFVGYAPDQTFHAPMERDLMICPAPIQQGGRLQSRTVTVRLESLYVPFVLQDGDRECFSHMKSRRISHTYLLLFSCERTGSF